jgi:hypothetical protein
VRRSGIAGSLGALTDIVILGLFLLWENPVSLDDQCCRTKERALRGGGLGFLNNLTWFKKAPLAFSMQVFLNPFKFEDTVAHFLCSLLLLPIFRAKYKIYGLEFCIFVRYIKVF